MHCASDCWRRNGSSSSLPLSASLPYRPVKALLAVWAGFGGSFLPGGQWRVLGAAYQSAQDARQQRVTAGAHSLAPTGF